jgi:hypothetical protein
VRLAGAFALALFGCGQGAAPPVAANPTQPPPAVAEAGAPSASAPAPATPVPASGCATLDPKLPELITTDMDVANPPVKDFSDADQMAPVWQKLAKIVRKRGDDSVRIAVYGDSNMTRDYITGELRRTLQAQFGDAGHGFVAVGKPWSWYLHEDVKHGVADGWVSYNMTTKQVADRLYGLGGIAAQSQMPGARAYVETADAGSAVGQKANRVEVLYLQHPKNGTFDVVVDGKKLATIDTKAAQIGAGIQRYEVPDTRHKVELFSGPDAMKPVRLLGVVLERKEPGIVIDSLGIGGVNMQLIARGKRELMIETLRMRKYDLIVLLTGATEPDLPSHVASAKKLVATFKEALPQAAIMMLSPPDLAGGTIERPTRSIRINQIERQKLEVARTEKLVYWDFRAAMGGEQSIVHFAERKMAWTDFIHLTDKGGHYMGRRFAHALVGDFRRYLAKDPKAGCN